MPAPTTHGGSLPFLIDFFGKDKLLTEITGNDVAQTGGVAAGP